MSLSMHVDNRNTGILVVGKGPMQGLDNTTLTAEKKYAVNISEHRKKFSIIIGRTVIYLLTVLKYTNPKQRFLK